MLRYELNYKYFLKELSVGFESKVNLDFIFIRSKSVFSVSFHQKNSRATKNRSENLNFDKLSFDLFSLLLSNETSKIQLTLLSGSEAFNVYGRITKNNYFKITVNSSIDR